MKIAVSAPWYISNTQIREEICSKILEEVIKDTIKKLLGKMEHHQNELIRQITQVMVPRNPDSHLSLSLFYTRSRPSGDFRLTLVSLVNKNLLPIFHKL